MFPAPVQISPGASMTPNDASGVVGEPKANASSSDEETAPFEELFVSADMAMQEPASDQREAVGHEKVDVAGEPEIAPQSLNLGSATELIQPQSQSHTRTQADVQIASSSQLTVDPMQSAAGLDGLDRKPTELDLSDAVSNKIDSQLDSQLESTATDDSRLLDGSTKTKSSQLAKTSSTKAVAASSAAVVSQNASATNASMEASTNAASSSHPALNSPFQTDSLQTPSSDEAATTSKSNVPSTKSYEEFQGNADQQHGSRDSQGGAGSESSSKILPSPLSGVSSSETTSPTPNQHDIALPAAQVENTYMPPAETDPRSVPSPSILDSTASAMSPSASTTQRWNTSATTNEIATTHEAAIAKQVASHIVSARLEGAKGSQQLEIRLDPPHLGTISVEIVETNDQLVAKVTAVDPAAFQALQSNTSSLFEAFEQAGIEFEEFTFGQQHDEGDGHSHDRQSASLTRSFTGADAESSFDSNRNTDSTQRLDITV